MGCDGGTIPRRDELVRLKKKPEQVRKLVLNNLSAFMQVLILICISER